MTTRIKLRRDTAANWTLQNPVLALGEPGYDTTNNKLKVGDGVTRWNSLSYLTDATGGGGGLSFNEDGTLTLPNGGKLGPVQYPTGVELFTDNPAGYTQLNWGNTQFVWTDSGGVSFATADVLRAGQGTWHIDTSGILNGPAMGGLPVSGYIIGMNGITLEAANSQRNTAVVQFLDADGTSKSVYTVDYNIYNIGGMNDSQPNIQSKTLWVANGQSVNIVSAVASNNPTTITITLAEPVTLQATTDYTIDWYVYNPQTVNIATDNSYWNFEPTGDTVLPSTGSIRQNNSYTRTSNNSNVITAPTVVWTSLRNDISSVKLIIQAECDEQGDTTGWHSQTCEAIIASRGYSNAGPGVGDPVMTVYGVVHTSVAPLMTYSVQRNLTTKCIEVVATPTATAGTNGYVKVHSVEMVTRD